MFWIIVFLNSETIQVLARVNLDEFDLPDNLGNVDNIDDADEVLLSGLIVI